jgi:SAM-dependent methyltransferase
MKFENITCPICNTDTDYKILFPRNFEPKDLNTRVFSARRIPDRIHYRIIKCNHCGLVRSSPTIDPKLLGSLYIHSKLTYDNEINNLTETYINSLAPVLDKLPLSARLLEIGCGNGFILNQLYNRGFTHVFGVEPSLDAVDKADIQIRNFIKNDILKPGLYKKDSFDFIFFFQTFDHIPDPNTFLALCGQLLKPGGYILTFNHDVDSISGRLLGEKSPIFDIEHTFLYSPETVRKIFSLRGFINLNTSSPVTVLSLRHLLWLLPIPDILKKFTSRSRFGLLDIKISLKLGNVSLVGQKP